VECIKQRIQPDIFLLKNNHLVFVIDVKVGVGKTDLFNAALEKLTIIATKCGAQVYLVSVADKLAFDINKAKDYFIDFYRAGGYVIAPANGSLMDKVSSINLKVATLEYCLKSIIDAL